MRSFYVYKRSNGIFYVQFVDPISKRILSGRSTRTRVYDEAVKQSYEWLLCASVAVPKETAAQRIMSLAVEKKFSADEVIGIQNTLSVYYKNELGISIPSENRCMTAIGAVVKKNPLLAYLKDFWNYEASEYVQDKLQHGQRIGKQYCYEMTNTVKYWSSFFSDKDTLEDLTTKRLQGFEKFLRERVTEKTDRLSGEKVRVQLSTTTMSTIIKCGTIAFSWAVKKNILSINPSKGLTAYTIKNKKRGVLSPEEAESLFRFGSWKDERSRVASLVAMTCGLRIGEILALHENDVGNTMLYVRHSWSTKGKLGQVKNGEERMVPLLPSVRSELQKLALQNPHKDKDSGFIFWGVLPNKPVVQNVLTDDFRDALKSIGITEVERKSRNIVFHSWRHYYAVQITKRVELAQAQQALGHLTPEMTKHYANHKTIKDMEVVGQAVHEAFKDVIPAFTASA